MRWPASLAPVRPRDPEAPSGPPRSSSSEARLRWRAQRRLERIKNMSPPAAAETDDAPPLACDQSIRSGGARWRVADGENESENVEIRENSESNQAETPRTRAAEQERQAQEVQVRVEVQSIAASGQRADDAHRQAETSACQQVSPPRKRATLLSNNNNNLQTTTTSSSPSGTRKIATKTKKKATKSGSSTQRGEIESLGWLRMAKLEHRRAQSRRPGALALLFLLAAAAATATSLNLIALGPVGGSAQVFKASSQAAPATSGAGNQQAAGSVGCPYPPVNPNCQVNIIAQAPAVPLLAAEFLADEYSTLKQDTQATYKCDQGYELLGSEQITCLASGRWSASPPNCVTNIALGKPTNQSSTVRGGDSRNANDGKLTIQHDGKHCTETKVDQSPWWQIDLLQVYDVRSIRILGRACCNPQMGLHDIEIRVGNSSTLQGNRLCAWYPSNLDEGVPRDFQCAHPILGRFVSIQMVGIESALSLCEVMVFSTKEFHQDRCNQSGIASENQVVVFNRTCYETQATNGGSFLVADTYCKARGGSLLHSVNDLTHSFISQELERMKTKLKSKLVWLGAKRETASPNAQGPITPGSSSALLGSDPTIHHTFASDRSLSASLHDFPIESLFSNDHGLISAGETSSIFSPAVKLSRSALLQASSGAGGSTSRGSQTFGLQTSGSNNHHHLNRSIEHPGRSLIVSQPSQVASYFTSPVPAAAAAGSGSSLAGAAPSPIVSPSQSSSGLSSQSSSPIVSFASSGNTHVHRTLRPPSLVSAQASAAAASSSSSWNPSRLVDTSTVASSSQTSTSPSSSSSSSPSSWRWVGDAASDTLQSPITNFLWAEDQPNNYNNQQDCIVMDGAKRWLWNDVTCELDYLPWVCQFRASTCGSPDRHENSTILEVSPSAESDGSSEKAYQLGKTITYTCPVGHRLDGPRTRKCLHDGSWSARAPKCQYVNCGPIGSQTIENGRLVYLNQSQTTYGSQVKYVCYEDYVLVGEDTRQCQADGRWGGKQPYCAYKWCPVLQQISNGQLNVTSYSENSIATYQCNSGYKLIGNDTRQCLLGGKWTNQEPFCQFVDCGQPKQIPNASHELVNGTTNYLSIAQYTCNENYTLVGHQSNRMVCSHNNRWTGREPQCSLIDCGQPQVNAGSRFSGDSFTVHSSIDYKCDPGFKEVSGSTQRTCGLDGQWTGTPLVCKYVDCGRVPAILKGEMSYINGTTYLASQVSYECTPGNRISGHKIRFCGPDGRWTGSSPKCEEEQSFSVGVTVQYECDYGHVVKGSWASRLCQANGEWSGEPPVCKFVDCGAPPSIENGNYLLKHPPAGSAGVGSATPIELARRSDTTTGGGGAVGTFTYYGTIAHYNCEANYKLQGPAQRECLESGQWRTPLPTCEPIACPKPEFFDEFTQVSLIPKSQSPSGGDQQSAPGEQHSLTTAKSLKLIAAGQWLTSASGPYGQNHTFGVGDKLFYSCQPGYELYGGPEIRTCTQYGQWSGTSTPRCRMIDCGKPAPIGQEGRFFLLNDTTTFNSLVEYSCVRPFKLVEVKIRQAGNLIETLTNAQAGVTPILTSLPIGVKVCANNGQWMPNDQAPKCTTGASPSPTFDGADNTLDGTNRQVPVHPSGSGSSHHPSFINVAGGGQGQGQGQPGNQLDGDASNLDATSSGQQAGASQSAYFWAKVLLVISLPLMFAIITITLICIRSKKPKQVAAAAHRNSILSPAGHHPAAAAAAAAMQLQLANGKSPQQHQAMLLAQSHHHHHHLNGHHPNHHQAASSLMAANHQNQLYMNGMQKMFPAGAMVGQSQMSSAMGIEQHVVHPSSYGDASSHHHAGALMGAKANGAAARSMIAINQGEVMLMNNSNSNNKSSGSLGILGQARLAQNSGSSADSYSRLSIDSDQHGPGVMAGSGSSGGGSGNGANGLGHKTIRHNPNGLVTFVSPAQQQQQQQQQKAASAGQQQQVVAGQSASSSSASSGVSSTSHQISPQSISTPLSVSSSSSSPTSSSSTSAHHTTATRLSGTDSTSSPTSSQSGHHNHHHHMHNHHHHHHSNHNQNHLQHQEQSEYQAPQQIMQQVPVMQASPPSLPAHPPPPHRLQQHHKQLMKHHQPPKQMMHHQQAGSVQPQQQQLNGDHHYTEPSV